MPLCRLIYCSQAIPELQYPDLADIMEKSQKNNRPLGLTGMLCYGNAHFLQLLEGDRAHVSKTYERIASDRRHFDTEIIDCSDIESRLFNQWDMRVVSLVNYSAPEVRDIILKYSSSGVFNPKTMSAHQCLKFLEEFAIVVKASE